MTDVGIEERIGINTDRAGRVQIPVEGYRRPGRGRENRPDAIAGSRETKSLVSVLDRQQLWVPHGPEVERT